MKKIFVSLVLGYVLFSLSNIGLSQSYQMPNRDFETDFDNDGEPPHWSSFMTSNCTLGSFMCGYAQTTKHSWETGRPGSLGQHSVRIYATAVIGIVANGTMTSGRIHAGSTTPDDPANYNYTQRSDTNFSCLFPATGTPDSLYIWVKYTAGSGNNARISAIIHGNTDFKDPNDANTPSLYRGKAIINFSPTDWVLKKIPFVYDGTCTDNTNYIIVTFTTNETPGGGAAEDALYVDDIELIYSAWLTDIKMDGQTISGFAPGILTYDTVYPRGTDPSTAIPTITYTSEKNDVTIKDTLIMGINNSIDSAKRIIEVTAEDGVTIKTYTINFSIWKSSDATINEFAYTLNGAPATVNLQDSVSTIQNVYILLSPGTTYTPVITPASLILADTGARVINIVQPTAPNSIATVTVRAENGNMKTYQIHFSVQKSSNADLKTLTYGSPIPNTSVPNFHHDTLVYHVRLTPGTINAPQVAATMDWQGLNPNIQQATTLPGTATITATAEDNITRKIYTVHFTVMLDTNANLSKIEYFIGSTRKTITNFHADTLSYSVVLPYGTTQVTSLMGTCASSLATNAVTILQSSSLPRTDTIIVTAQNPSYTKTYTVNFTVAKNNDASLSAIEYELNGVTLSVPNFNPLIERYQVVLPPRTVAVPALGYHLKDINASAVVIDPVSTQDSGKITVTAENGTTTKTYTVVFSVALSTDVSLTNIKIEDTITHFDTILLSPNPNLSSYNIKLDTNLVPIITVTAADAGATYNIVYPNSIPGQAQIIVTAEDTNVKKTYRLNLSFASPDNPNLVDLSYELDETSYTVSNFHSDTLIYHIVLPSQTTQIPKIVCQTADFSASTFITQPLSPLGAGIIVVTSANGDTTKMYQIYFSVEISTNAKLDSLFYNGIPVSDFSPSQLTYTIELPYTTISPVVVSAKAQSKVAQVDCTTLSKIQDSAVVLVTAEDKQTNCRYVIHFSRQLSPVATLATLTYTLAGTDSTIADFQQDEFLYTVSLAPETISIPQLVFTPADANAQAQLIRTPLHPNDTAIIRVTAENQTAVADYRIVFSRIPSSNNRLSNLQYNGISLSNFNPDTLNYMVIFPWEETQIPVVTATSQWDSTTVNIPPIITVFDTVIIQVIPEDGGQARYYKIAFERGSNVELQDLRWSLDGNTYSSVENFDANDTGYHVLLPIGTTVRPVMEWDLEDSRCLVDVANDFSLPNGITTVTITGWDSLNVKIYTVEFEVELSTEAALSDLMVNGVTIANFHTDTLDYIIECEYGSGIPLVTATATQPDARIDYTQINEYPAVAVIKVFAGDTTVQREYTIAFSIEAGDNAFLSDLLIDSVSLADFDKNVFFYNVILPHGTTTLPIVSATAEDERATVTITQIAQFEDTAKIQLTAINGDIKEYQLYFTVDGNSNAYASNIFVDGKMVENFNATSRNYNYILPAVYIGIPVVTAELADPKASYTVKNAEQIPGQTVIIVIAENQRDTFSYRINFTKGTSVVSFENHTTLSIFPNPGSSVINFDLKGISQTANLEISTVDGKILGKYTLQEGINPVEIEHLQRGVYFYKVYTKKKILGTGKFIKQ